MCPLWRGGCLCKRFVGALSGTFGIKLSLLPPFMCALESGGIPDGRRFSAMSAGSSEEGSCDEVHHWAQTLVC